MSKQTQKAKYEERTMIRRAFIASAFAGALALAIAGAMPANAQRPVDPPGFARALAAQQAHTDRLLQLDGIVGTGIGVDARGQATLVVMTRDLGVRGVPGRLDGVSVVFLVTGQFRAVHHRQGHGGGPGGGGEEDPVGAAVDPTSRFDRPVPIGVSTGNITSCSAGTIGARVSDANNVYVLSNNHVLALENNASLGDVIVQPGVFDTNCAPNAGNSIGKLSAYVPLVFDGGDNRVDAAIAVSDIDTLGNGTPSNGYGTPRSETVAASVGQSVQKYGRTTGLTTGTVGAINATVNVGYGSGTARFVGQIIVDGNKGGFLNAGDSGSLLVVNGEGNDRAPVGLLFASGRGGKIAVANPIDEVLSAFGVMTIDGE